MPPPPSPCWTRLPCQRHLAAKKHAAAALTRSSEIDVQLRANRKLRARRIDMFVFGGESNTFMKGLQRLYGGFPADDLPIWRKLILLYLVRELREALAVVLTETIEISTLDEDDASTCDWRNDLDVLEKAHEDPCINGSLESPARLDDALLWCADNAEHFRTRLPEPAAYFLRDIARLVTEKYIPTEEDIMALTSFFRPRRTIPNTIHCSHTFGSPEYKITIRFIDTPRRGRKYLSMFDEANAIIQIIDLSTYDEMYEQLSGHPGTKQSTFLPQLTHLADWLRSRIFHPWIFPGVVFTNYAYFKTQLPTFPLSNLFPEHTDTQDPALEIAFLVSHILSDPDLGGLVGPYTFVCEERAPRTTQVVDFFMERMIEILLRPVCNLGFSSWRREEAVPPPLVFENDGEDDSKLSRSLSNASTAVG